MKKRKILVAISGASGVNLGLKCLANLVGREDLECFLAVSSGAKIVFKNECGLDFEGLFWDVLCESEKFSEAVILGEEPENALPAARFARAFPKNLKNIIESLRREKINIFEDSDLAAPPSSGSFGLDSMAILPCSTNTLSKIAAGFSDTLITRAAAVCLKERKNLLIAPREMPLNALMLGHCLRLCELGAIIAPPIVGYYSHPANLDEMEDFLIGKWLDALRIEHRLFQRWGEMR